MLSSSLNIGLINPSEIIEAVLKLNNININSKEDIRQIFWREYQRYCYNILILQNLIILILKIKLISLGIMELLKIVL